MKNIVTIMNFARGVDHRVQSTLYPTTEKQFELLNGSGLKSTFLLQHDAYIRPDYAELFSKRDENMEIGLWLEICKSLVLKAGLEYRGRPGYEFDWASNVDMPCGYTEREKDLLIDTAMEDFKSVFGFYPKTVGSWVLDSYTIERLGTKYGVVATCNCKDQWGTDGYTLFGGYYDNAYYPCKKNVLCPAQTEAEQIRVPHFRLLGCDPLYQYDCFLWSKCHVWSLEPWKFDESILPRGGGADPEWVDWYFGERFLKGNGLSFGYAQIGQENSFEWDNIKDALINQLNAVKKLKDKGLVEDLTFSEAGEWFLAEFPMSPPSTHTALTDWKDGVNSAVWYYCKNYRVGLMLTDKSIYIRDMHLYDENYQSIYNDDSLCTIADCYYDVPSVMNGVAWSDKDIRAGIYLINSETGENIIPENISYKEGGGGFELSFCHGASSVIIKGTEGELSITGTGISLKFVYSHLLDHESLTVRDNIVYFKKRGYPYSVELFGGVIDGNIISFDGKLSVKF